MDRYSDTLLDDEAINEDGPLNGAESGQHSRADPHANLPVYRTIHRCVAPKIRGLLLARPERLIRDRIRRLITTSIGKLPSAR